MTAVAAALADVAERFREPLRALLTGEIPTNVALMRVLAEAEHPGEAGRALAGIASAGLGRAERERLNTLGDMLRAHPDAWRTIRAVLAEARHDSIRDPAQDAGFWAETFDRVARLSPTAGVALYSLGDAALLARITAEAVGVLHGWGLIGPRRDVLDLGCGAGRMAAALAPLVHTVTGIDVSAGMIGAARHACAGLPNVTLEITDGRDLAICPDGAFDLVLALDSFPYLVLAGGALAERHVEEAARVLRPGGTLAILNYSYRGDLDADHGDLARHAARCGLTLEEAGTRPFTLWDGVAFRLRKPPDACGGNGDGDTSVIPVHPSEDDHGGERQGDLQPALPARRTR
ncbi:class I SAM-dependent methyltransferase [Faunimonas sp. B44]|uniref:class I SAM-dependent methyltransferase n=1 Tax=Faunimonas sp. B44 TaxID=3461493 RepID=UPI0040441995